MFPQHSSHWCTTRQFHYLTLRVWACQLWANTLCSCSHQWMLKGTGLTCLGFTLHQKNTLQNRRCFSVQGGESASRPQWSSFVHLKTPRNLCPPQQHVGISKAASLLLETLPMRNTNWSWSTFCSQHYYDCPRLNTLIILSNNFFEAREGVRLLMALKHFLKEV